jgi:prepilin-type processing-associated H-X9-DG protein
MEYAYWVDLPGTYHNSGAGFSFADGHTEAHRWKMSGHKEHGAITNPADREDWLWMRQRTSADSTGQMPPPS